MTSVRSLKRHWPRGFAAVAAIVILVILAILAAGLVKLGTAQQVTSAQDVLSARAWQAARAGNEWGLYRALRPSGANFCDGTPQTLNLSVVAGFRVTVSCTAQPFNEGEMAVGTARSISIYTISAVACNSAVACPDATMTNTSNYIERMRVVMACDTGLQLACN